MRFRGVLLVFPMLAALAAATDRSLELRAAIDLFAQRKNPEAKAAFEKLVAANPKDAEAHQHLGLLALRADDPKAAVKHLEQAVALASQNSALQDDLGDAYCQTAQKANVFTKMSWAGKCRTAFEKAVALDPANVNARLSLMSYYQQAPGIAGGGMEKAYAQADAVMKLDLARGRAARAGLLAADKKYDQAFDLYEQSLVGRPDDYLSLYAIGRLAATTGDRLERGIDALRKSLTLAPPANAPGHAAAHWRLGNLFEKKGDKAAARASYETALKLDPSFAQARKSLSALK